MKIESLNTEHVSFGILFFGKYSTPYIESSYKELNIVIQAFRSMIDKVDSLIRLSNKLKEGKLYENCIGENETTISFKNGFFQFYSIMLNPEIYLEIEALGWISLLEKLKSFMIEQEGKSYFVKF